MKPFLLPPGIALLLLTLWSCGGGSDPRASEAPPETVSLQIDWYAQPEYGGFYQSLAMAPETSAGVRLEISPGGPGKSPLRSVAAGQTEYGTSTTTKLIPAIEKGMPLVAIAGFRQRTLRILVLHDSDPAQGFEDLRGRRLKARPEDLWVDFLQHRYELNLRIIPHDFGMGQFLSDPTLVQQV